MAGNPTVIPGLFKADLSGLALLAESIGHYMRRDERKIGQAMETFRDPVFMEKAAESMATALAKDELNPDYAKIAGDANRSSAFSRVVDSQMIAAELDPTNQKHRQAAVPILETAYQSLPLAQRAAARLRGDAEAQKEADVQQKAAQKVVGKTIALESGATDLAQWEVNLRKKLWVTTQSTAENEARLDKIISDLRIEMMRTADEEWQNDPYLASLMQYGGKDAFVDGVLKYMGMSPAQAVLTVENEFELAQLTEAREKNFGLRMEEIIATNLSGEKLKAALSTALNRYQSYGNLEKYGLQNSMFPMNPILYTSTRFLGLFEGSVKMRMGFAFPPPGSNLEPVFYAKWMNSIIAKYNREGETPASVLAELEKSPTWQALAANPDHRAEVLGALATVGVRLPLDFKTPTDALSLQTPRKTFAGEADPTLHEPLIHPTKSALELGFEKVPGYLKAFSEWLPSESALQAIFQAEEEEEK